MIKLKLKIGQGMLEYEDADIKTIHRFSAIYGMLPEVCDACGSNNIFLSYKNPKGNDYYTIACKKCGAELAFHQKKEGGFYLVAGEKMTVYKGSDQAQELNDSQYQQDTTAQHNVQAVNETFNNEQPIDPKIPF